jgi:hypothetical protein
VPDEQHQLLGVHQRVLAEQPGRFRAEPVRQLRRGHGRREVRELRRLQHLAGCGQPVDTRRQIEVGRVDERRDVHPGDHLPVDLVVAGGEADLPT